MKRMYQKPMIESAETLRSKQVLCASGEASSAPKLEVDTSGTPQNSVAAW